MYRFKTREEFENSYGVDWRQKVRYIWVDGMDYLFGQRITDCDYEKAIKDELHIGEWCISQDMIVRCDELGRVIEDEPTFDESYYLSKDTSDDLVIGSSEVVNHPVHYKGNGIEAIDVIESFGFGYHLGNTFKYICRAGKKNPEKEIEDLEKAEWYLKRYVEKRKKELRKN